MTNGQTISPSAPNGADGRPTVSVILPCYNTHRYLDQALDSIRAQTLRDVEIIVVNDGSTDPETIAHLNGLHSDVTVIHQENRGLPAARNTGFRAARGRYVLPLDCDDWLEPDFLEKTLSALKRMPELSFATSYLVLEADETGVLEKRYNCFEQLFLNQLPYCLLIKRASWEYAGGYNENLQQGYEDWEFNVRLGGLRMFGTVVEEPLFHYRVSQSGMLKSVSSTMHAELWSEIQKCHGNLYRPAALFRTWCIWRRKPMTYSPAVLLAWLAIYKILPTPAFNFVLRSLRFMSHSRRVSRSSRRALQNRTETTGG